jgi:anti-anti-sigma factor
VDELVRLEAEQRPGLCLLRLRGEVDISNATELLSEIQAAVPNNAALVAVDLSETTYLDSAGLQIIFLLAQRLNDRRQSFRLVVPKDAPIRATLELASMARVVPMQDHLEDG